MRLSLAAASFARIGSQKHLPVHQGKPHGPQNSSNMALQVSNPRTVSILSRALAVLRAHREYCCCPADLIAVDIAAIGSGHAAGSGRYGVAPISGRCCCIGGHHHQRLTNAVVLDRSDVIGVGLQEVAPCTQQWSSHKADCKCCALLQSRNDIPKATSNIQRCKQLRLQSVR
jgi:hypothetical protein